MKKIIFTALILFIALPCVTYSQKSIPPADIQKKIYSDMNLFHEGLSKVQRGKLIGFIDRNGKEVIPCQYSDASYFSDGLSRIENNDSIFYIDKTGNKAFSVTPYISYSSFSNGRLLICDKNWKNYGFMNKKGDIVIPCIYDFAHDFSDEGITFVTTDEWVRSVIDTNGNIIGKGEAYYNHSPFYGGVAIVSTIIDEVEKWFLVNRYQNIVFEFHDIYPNHYSENLAIVKQNDKYGYMDKKGNITIPCIYDDVDDFANGIARVLKNKKYGLINEKGKEIIPCIYEGVDYFTNGIASVVKNKKCGYINKKGKEIIPCIYEDAEPFSNNLLAPIQKDGLWGYINKKGEIIIPCQYQSATIFSEGLALVSNETNFMYIDKNNKIILSFLKSK